MAREYPDRPVVGIGGVVIENQRALLIKRGSEPLLGQWSIPGGTLELGESLQQGVARELLEETGLAAANSNDRARPKYHYVIVDYLCERLAGEARAASDVTDIAYATEQELEKFQMTSTAMRVLRRAFAMDQERRKER